MSDTSLESVVGLVAANSLSYVAEAFSFLNQGHTVVNLRSEDDAERISAFNIQRVELIDVVSGWYQGPAYQPQPSNETIAQILFTSGTEGAPKSILLSHRALANTTQRLIDVMALDSQIKEYVGVPVNYSFGFGRCRAVSAVGGKFFIPENGFDPAEIAVMLESKQINAVSAVPTLWRIVLSNPDLFDGIGDKLKWIEIGSQYMSRAEKEKLKAIFPNANIVQHYGLTEASRTTFLKIHETEGDQLESVGSCIDDNQIRINGEGRIEIKGSHLASGMIQNGASLPLTNEESWFETKDLGRIAQGLLYYEGRADDLINCGGIKLSPEHLEQVIYDTMGIRSGVAIAGVPDPMRGQVPVLAYTSELEARQHDLVAAFKHAVKASGVDMGVSIKKKVFDVFPSTSTGKIQRRKIAERFVSENTKTKQRIQEHQTKPNSIATEIKQVWQEVLGIHDVPTNVSFFDLGGDSLSSISVALRMEKLGVDKSLTKKIFEGYTIQEIAEAASDSNAPLKQGVDATAAISQSTNLTRGVLVLLVVLAHWMPGVIERLPAQFAEYNKYLSTLYSFGTPGFATIFGFGVGFFYLLRYLSSPESLNSMIRRNAIILFSGMTLLAVIRLWRHALDVGELSSLDVANAYFSVLYFYFFAVISIPLLLKITTRHQNITYAALQVSVVSFAIHIFIETLRIPPSENGLIQAAVLLLTTKYNYFEMMAGLAAGMAIGNWVREHQRETGIHKTIGVLGVLLLAFSIILCWEMDDWEMLMEWPKVMTIWSWLMYLGLVCIMWAVCYELSSRTHRPVFEATKNILCCIGMLAFPMFIGHELVIPLKDVFWLLGLPMALPISMGLFFGLATFAIRKMYLIYYK